MVLSGNCDDDVDHGDGFGGDEHQNDNDVNEVDDVKFRMMGVSCSNGDRDPDGETLLQIAASPPPPTPPPTPPPACALAC